MREFGFHGIEIETLKMKLSKPIKEIGVIYREVANDSPSLMTLRTAEPGMIMISNRMHDIAERQEVGILQIDIEADLQKYYNQSDVMIYRFKDAFIPKNIRLMKIEIDGSFYHSGLEFMNSRKDIIRVVAAAFPFTIHVDGPYARYKNNNPEFSLDDYVRVEISHDETSDC